MIYSANYGAWDPQRAQPVPVQMFSEQTNAMSTLARYIRPAATHGHNADQTQNRLDAKWWKLNPQAALPGEPVTIWIDASVTILRPDFADLCLAELGEDDALFMRHPWRDCIYEEAEASLVPGLHAKYGGQYIPEQTAAYRAAGHPDHWGLVQSTVLVRRNTSATREMNDRWWTEIVHWSIQDQISLPYVLRRMGDLRWHYWPVNPIAAGWLRWGMFNA